MNFYRKLVDHFNGDKGLALITIGLLVFGMLIFLINNTVLFFVNEGRYFWPRLCLKGMTDGSWLLAAMLGTTQNRTKRNMLMMPVLVFYVLGDLAVFFSIPVGGALYGVGHIFFLMAILETSYIHKYQKIVLAVSVFIPVIVLFIYVKNNFLLIIIGIIYGFIIVSVMALSLSNRFFWLAGVVFTLSDLAGLIRVAAFNNKITYVITTAIYFAAYFMLCISVFSTSRKEVVTWGDLNNLLKSKKIEGIRFWVCGKWGTGLILGKRKYSYPFIELAYATDEEEAFMKWLEKNRYQLEPVGPDGLPDYYSERYGKLRALPCEFREDGTIRLQTYNHVTLELDEGFFEEVRVMGREVPCIAPGGQELIIEAAAHEQKAETETPKKADAEGEIV